MIAQIRTGLWVRNGFAIRGQLLHYRDFMLRELCYDQDLFVLQTALIMLPPDLIFVSILDRFQMRGYFSLAEDGGQYEGEDGAATRQLHPQYEGAQLAHMAEELLYVFTVLLGERDEGAGELLHP